MTPEGSRGGAAPLRFAVAADLASLAAETRPFALTLAIALIVLGLGLIAALALQISYGLKPLTDVQEALAAGRCPRRPGAALGRRFSDRGARPRGGTECVDRA